MEISSARLAVIEDDPLLREVLARVLSASGYRPELFANGSEFLESRRASSFDVVMTDLQMEGASGLDVLKACRAEPDAPEVLLVTGFASIRNAVEAMRLGAFDYLSKPVDPKELLHRVAQALDTRRLKRAVDALSGEVRRRSETATPVCESPAMRACLARAARAAASSSTVLILGETGTGKDVVARHIRETGSRSGRTYLTLNCAALPENLLESELFGHARGAFSGAHAMKRGLFEEADGGTLFLDEIGSMTPGAQAKLLRVLEEGAVRRVGENQPIRLDVRIIAATNRDLRQAVSRGEFREDLFYRLAVVTLEIPPLRSRVEDIEPLARLFLAESVRRIGRMRLLAPETIDFLRAYSFPGNIRELRHAIEQAVILSEDGTIYPSDFSFPRREIPAAREGAPRDITRERLDEALRESGGNRVQAARSLGISRATFYRLLERPEKPPDAASAGGAASNAHAKSKESADR